MNTELTLDPQFNPQSGNKIKKSTKEPWNKGKLMGQKPPLKLKEVWEICIRLQLGKRLRELALFNLAIDSKLRGCDLVKLKVRDIAHGDQITKRAMVMQQKTHQPVQFEITEPTRGSVMDWIKQAKLKSEDFLFPSRIHGSLILPPGSMPESSKNGSQASD
jgi:integrase